MKRIALAAWLSAALLISGGCKNQPSDNDAIRVGILQHLNGVGTLNMSAMEMEMRTVSVNGNQAHAAVVFRPKTGAPPAACRISAILWPPPARLPRASCRRAIRPLIRSPQVHSQAPRIKLQSRSRDRSADAIAFLRAAVRHNRLLSVAEA